MAMPLMNYPPVVVYPPVDSDVYSDLLRAPPASGASSEDMPLNGSETSARLPNAVSFKDNTHKPAKVKSDWFDNSFQQALLRAQKRILGGYLPREKEEWRLPHAPVPSRPDFSRVVSIRDEGRRQRRRGKHKRSDTYPKSTKENSSELEYVLPPLPIETLYRNELSNLPTSFPSTKLKKNSLSSSQPVYLPFVGSASLHPKTVSRTVVRQPPNPLPELCHGCRGLTHLHNYKGYLHMDDYEKDVQDDVSESGKGVSEFDEEDEEGIMGAAGVPMAMNMKICHGCAISETPHFHYNNADVKRASGGFTYIEAPPPTCSHFSSSDSGHYDSVSQTNNLPLVHYAESDKEHNNSHEQVLFNVEKISEPDGPVRQLTVPRQRPPKLPQWIVDIAEDPQPENAVHKIRHYEDHCYACQQAEIQRLEDELRISEEEEDAKERERRAKLEEERIKKQEEEKERRKGLYKAPKPFKIKKQESHVTKGEDPFSKDRSYNIPKTSGFRVKKSEKALTQSMEITRDERSWKQPKKFELKKGPPITTSTDWNPPEGKERVKPEMPPPPPPPSRKKPPTVPIVPKKRETMEQIASLNEPKTSPPRKRKVEEKPRSKPKPEPKPKPKEEPPPMEVKAEEKEVKVEKEERKSPSPETKISAKEPERKMVTLKAKKSKQISKVKKEKKSVRKVAPKEQSEEQEEEQKPAIPQDKSPVPFPEPSPPPSEQTRNPSPPNSEDFTPTVSQAPLSSPSCQTSTPESTTPPSPHLPPLPPSPQPLPTPSPPQKDPTPPPPKQPTPQPPKEATPVPTKKPTPTPQPPKEPTPPPPPSNDPTPPPKEPTPSQPLSEQGKAPPKPKTQPPVVAKPAKAKKVKPKREKRKPVSNRKVVNKKKSVAQIDTQSPSAQDLDDPVSKPEPEMENQPETEMPIDASSPLPAPVVEAPKKPKEPKLPKAVFKKKVPLVIKEYVKKERKVTAPWQMPAIPKWKEGVIDLPDLPEPATAESPHPNPSPDISEQSPLPQTPVAAKVEEDPTPDLPSSPELPKKTAEPIIWRKWQEYKPKKRKIRVVKASSPTKSPEPVFRDALDFLARYCIVHKERVPHYQHVFNKFLHKKGVSVDESEEANALKANSNQFRVKGLPAQKTSSSDEEMPSSDKASDQKDTELEKTFDRAANSGDESYYVSPLQLNSADSEDSRETSDAEGEPEKQPVFVLPPTQSFDVNDHLDKLAFTIGNLYEKTIFLQEEVHQLQETKKSRLARLARQEFPEIVRADYDPNAALEATKNTKKGKKKKKDKENDEEVTVLSVVEQLKDKIHLTPTTSQVDVTNDEWVLGRLNEFQHSQLEDTPQMRTLTLRLDRTEEKLENAKERMHELLHEKEIVSMMGKNLQNQEISTRPAGKEEFRRKQSRLYQDINPLKVHGIDIGDVEPLMRQVNRYLITEKECQYVYHVLELPQRHQLDFKLFTVVAALSEKVSNLDPFIRKMINKMDFEALDVKMTKAKELFYLLEDEDSELCGRGEVPLHNLKVELEAGGLSQEHVEMVVDKFGREGKQTVDFLDFLTYILLFIDIHDYILDDPLNFSRDR